jgi:small subunit ribosomal protein S2
MLVNISYTQLIIYGVHIGHSINNTMLYASWMLYAIRQKIWIINLVKTMSMLRYAFPIIKFTIETYGPLWFINLNKAMSRVVGTAAKNCGEFFSSTYWIKGMLSNYLEVAKTNRLFIAQSGNIKNRKALLFNLNFKNWNLTRFSWPRSAFISSVSDSPLATREAYCLGIPCLAIVDTNVKSQAVNLAIPGNDESLNCIIYYNAIVSNYVLLCKFSMVLLWCISVRNKKRLVAFNEWVMRAKLKISLNLLRGKELLSFAPNYNVLFSKAFSIYFSYGYWQNQKFDKLNILSENSGFFDKKQLISFFNKSLKKNLFLSTIYFSKLVMKWFFLFKKRRKSLRLFKQPRFWGRLFINGHFLFYFLDGRFFRKHLKDFTLIKHRRFLNFIRYYFMIKANTVKLISPVLYSNKQHIRRRFFSKVLLMFKKVYLKIAIQEACSDKSTKLHKAGGVNLIKSGYCNLKLDFKLVFANSFKGFSIIPEILKPFKYLGFIEKRLVKFKKKRKFTKKKSWAWLKQISLYKKY